MEKQNGKPSNTISMLLKEKLHKENLSYRKAAPRCGVSHTTLQRATEGKRVDLKTLSKIADWLGVSLSNIVDGCKNINTLSNRIAIIIEREPKLRKLFEEILDAIEEGIMAPEDLNDIVAYAGYKLKLKG